MPTAPAVRNVGAGYRLLSSCAPCAFSIGRFCSRPETLRCACWRAVPREVEELRTELKRKPSPEEALARLDKDFRLTQLGTQLSVETLLPLLVGSLEAPCAEGFAAPLPYAQRVPRLHDATRAIATGRLHLGIWKHLLAETDVAELRTLFAKKFPSELSRAAAD